MTVKIGFWVETTWETTAAVIRKSALVKSVDNFWMLNVNSCVQDRNFDRFEGIRIVQFECAQYLLESDKPFIRGGLLPAKTSAVISTAVTYLLFRNQTRYILDPSFVVCWQTMRGRNETRRRRSDLPSVITAWSGHVIPCL